MTEPNIEQLAVETAWSLDHWAQAWRYVRLNFPPHGVDIVWQAVVALAPLNPPIYTAVSLKQAIDV